MLKGETLTAIADTMIEIGKRRGKELRDRKRESPNTERERERERRTEILRRSERIDLIER